MDNRDPVINLHINEGSLDRSGSNKYMGIQIDSELKWREHITFAIGKISRAMGVRVLIQHQTFFITRISCMLIFIYLCY